MDVRVQTQNSFTRPAFELLSTFRHFLALLEVEAERKIRKVTN